MLRIIHKLYYPETSRLYSEYFFRNRLSVFDVKGRELGDLLVAAELIESYDFKNKTVRFSTPCLVNGFTQIINVAMYFNDFVKERVDDSALTKMILIYLEKRPSKKPSLMQSLLNWVLRHPVV